MICLLIGITSCAGSNKNSEKSGTDVNSNEAFPSILGQWEIVNVVENDTSYVRPSEIEQGSIAYIDFNEDQTFGVMTNCNHLGGQYEQNNDSIRLSNILTTEMACDNMGLEEMLKKVLPIVNSIDCTNDSITRLNSEKGESYIVLKKTNNPVK